MKLTKEQFDLLGNRLSNFDAHCSTCGKNEFSILDRIFESREFQGGDLILGGDTKTLPMIVLTCVNCGEFRFMSALRLGILDNTEKEVRDDGKK